MLPLATAAQMRELDRQAIEERGVPSLELMEHAAQAVADTVWELIQPNEASSTWRNYLNEHGEGIHHVAFNIQGMKMPEAVKRCEDFGMTLEQKGEYGDASGRYVYMNAYKDLKCIVELLESDK